MAVKIDSVGLKNGDGTNYITPRAFADNFHNPSSNSSSVPGFAKRAHNVSSWTYLSNPSSTGYIQQMNFLSSMGSSDYVVMAAAIRNTNDTASRLLTVAVDGNYSVTSTSVPFRCNGFTSGGNITWKNLTALIYNQG